MNSRAKKYIESRKAAKGGKKETPATAGNNKQNKKSIKQPKENPDLPIKRGQPEVQVGSATQDDTGGGNDSGKRSDEN
jgi:hypothetical protein